MAFDGAQGRRGSAAARDCGDAEGRAGHTRLNIILPSSRRRPGSRPRILTHRRDPGLRRDDDGNKRCIDSMTQLVLHDYFRSSASFRVRIAMTLQGLDYSRVEVSLIAGEQRSDAFREQNAQGYVPMSGVRTQERVVGDEWVRRGRRWWSQ